MNVMSEKFCQQPQPPIIFDNRLDLRKCSNGHLFHGVILHYLPYVSLFKLEITFIFAKW